MPYLERLATEIQSGRSAAVVKVVDAPRESAIAPGAALLVGPEGLLAGDNGYARLVPASADHWERWGEEGRA